MIEILKDKKITKIRLINEGHSHDMKYAVKTEDGSKFLVRLSNISFYNHRRTLFDMLQELREFDIPIQKPIEFGVCNGGQNTYQLLSWAEGMDAKIMLPKTSKIDQYKVGLQSGYTLRKIHSIPICKQGSWPEKVAKETTDRIQRYYSCGQSFINDEMLVDYIGKTLPLATKRPQSFLHGDYHLGNIVISNDRKLTVIDWNLFGFGDPWADFQRTAWDVVISPYYVIGQLHAYFGEEPPLEFFRLLAFYISSNTIWGITWASEHAPDQLDFMLNQASNVLKWFNCFKSIQPTWYISRSDITILLELEQNKKEL